MPGAMALLDAGAGSAGVEETGPDRRAAARTAVHIGMRFPQLVVGRYENDVMHGMPGDHGPDAQCPVKERELAVSGTLTHVRDGSTGPECDEGRAAVAARPS
ncbi:hypothetical protein GCM10009530_41510 [Microbispora corallina]|uniref:Uncharacterized protein n=1 Tax=Microbispora corallina TaxID=83302 RepID=A0ABQ4G1I0_9ACTN|nr:hypothetical protein Mco01_39200 [Microbispora corallina]